MRPRIRSEPAMKPIRKATHTMTTIEELMTSETPGQVTLRSSVSV